MNALSVRQPFATLVATGAKRFETRSWSTSYRGPLAIHATRGWDRDDMRLALQLERRGVLAVEPRDLPRGAVIAMCRLVAIHRTSQWPPELVLSDLEVELGDYSVGRFAWQLADVVALPAPVPWRGELGLWEWPEP